MMHTHAPRFHKAARGVSQPRAKVDRSGRSHLKRDGRPKVTHLTMEAAQAAADAIDGHVYRCSECSGLHIAKGRR